MFVFRLQLCWRLTPFRIEWNAVHRANLLALRFFVVTNTFRTFMRVDFVNLRPHKNRVIRAFGFTHVAVNAIVGNHQGHTYFTFISSAHLRHGSNALFTFVQRVNLLLEPTINRRENELGYITAKHGDFTHDRA